MGMPRAKRVQTVETYNFFEHGSNSSVTSSASQLTTTSYRAKSGVLVTVDVDNTETVYVGKSDVTAGTADATDGLPLLLGGGVSAVVVPILDPSEIYVIAPSGTQKVYWFLV